MPPVLAAIPLIIGALDIAAATIAIGISAAGIGTAAAVGISEALIYGGLSYGLTSAAQAIIGGPPKAQVGPSRNPFGAQADEPRTWCYGRGATGGSLAYWETVGSDNKDVWFVNVVHDTQCDAFENFYVNNVLVNFTSNAAVKSNVTLTGCHITNGSNIVTVASTSGLQSGQLVASSEFPTGAMTIYSVDSTTQFRVTMNANTTDTNATLTISQTTIYCDDDGSNPKMWRYDHLGSASQAADANLVAASATGTSLWTNKCRLQGMGYFVWHMEYDQNKFATGTPTPLLVLRGRRIYDPRQDPTYGGSGSQTRADESTWTWTDNSALCLLDYLLGVNLNGTRIGGCGIPIRALDIQSFINAANICDETVAAKDGSTVKRYTANGFVSSQEDKQGVIMGLLLSMSSLLVYRGGYITLIPGAAQTSVMSLSDSDLAGPITTTAAVSRQDKSNSITSVSADPAQLYATVAAPLLTVAQYVTDDGGIRLERELRHRFTTNLPTVQRINKLALANDREQFKIDGPFKPRAQQVSVGDTFMYSCVPASIVNQKMICLSRDLNDDGSVRIVAREETDAKYSWADSEEQDAPRFNINQKLDPTLIARPLSGDVSATATAISGANGSSVPALHLTANAPPSAFVREILTRWKLHSGGDATYSPGPTIKITPGASSYQTNITGIAYGVSYDVGFAYRTDFATSEWQTVANIGGSTQVIVTDQINQGAVTNTQAAASTSPTNVGSWTPPTITTTSIGSGNKYRLATVSGVGSDHQVELFLSGGYNATSSDDYDVYFWFEYEDTGATWHDIAGNPFVTRSHSLLDRPSFSTKTVISPGGLSGWSGTVAAFCYVSLHSIDLSHADLTVTELKR